MLAGREPGQTISLVGGRSTSVAAFPLTARKRQSGRVGHPTQFSLECELRQAVTSSRQAETAILLVALKRRHCICRSVAKRPAGHATIKPLLRQVRFNLIGGVLTPYGKSRAKDGARQVPKRPGNQRRRWFYRYREPAGVCPTDPGMLFGRWRIRLSVTRRFSQYAGPGATAHRCHNSPAGRRTRPINIDFTNGEAKHSTSSWLSKRR